MFSLNEAYYGKATLKEIDEIMCRIERKIAENPLVDIYCHLCAGKVALGDEGVVHLHKHSHDVIFVVDTVVEDVRPASCNQCRQ